MSPARAAAPPGYVHAAAGRAFDPFFGIIMAVCPRRAGLITLLTICRAS